MPAEPLLQQPFSYNGGVVDLTVADATGFDGIVGAGSVRSGPGGTPAAGTWASAPLRLLGYWHVASLDAPTVALVWSYALARAAHIALPAWAPGLLALVTWAVYIGDRLLDAHAGLRTPPQHRLRARHRFHWRHRRLLAALACAAAAASLWIVLVHVPRSALKPDSLVAVATLAYFSGVHARRSVPPGAGRWTQWSRWMSGVTARPLLVAGIFTAGCLLPAWSQSARNSAALAPLAVPALLLAAVAWLNVRAIGRWEARSQRGAGVALPAAIIAAACLFSALILTGVLEHARSQAALLPASVALSAMLLALLDARRHRLDPVALRALADLVLLTPLIPLLAFS